MKALDKVLEKAKKEWPKKLERWDFLSLLFLLALNSKLSVEFGLEKGLSTRVLLLASEFSNGEVYSIDWLKRELSRNLATIKALKGDPKWHFIRGDVTSLGWKKEKIDLLLADIGEEHLKEGLENFYPHLSEKAIIIVPAIHHKNQKNKAKILKEFSETHKDFIFLEIKTKLGVGILKRIKRD